MSTRIYREVSKRTNRVHLGYVFEDRGYRIKRSLRLSYQCDPQTAQEKKERRDAEALAQATIASLQLESYRNSNRIPEPLRLEEDFIQFFFGFIERFEDRPQRRQKFVAVYVHVTKFNRSNRLPSSQLTRQWLQGFVSYLQKHTKGQTVHSYWSCLRQVIRAAQQELLFVSDPTVGIKVAKKTATKLEALTDAELAKLIQLPATNEVVKKAFLFSALWTGLRGVDMRRLRWKDLKGDTLELSQSKTGGDVRIPLPADILSQLRYNGSDHDLVFPLPTSTTIAKVLRTWFEAAGIEKKAGLHTARRTFASRLARLNTPLAVISQLLGHSDFSHLGCYLKLDEEDARQHLARLPRLL